MNIFILDRCPRRAAEMLCDKHLPKMVVESAQMLASAARANGAVDEDMPFNQQGNRYKGGYANHPCTVWAGECHYHYEWLYQHGIALCFEYTMRFGKRHACQDPMMQLSMLADMVPKVGNRDRMTFALAMPDEYKQRDAVAAYRQYYRQEKAGFATWQKGRPMPDWYRYGESTREVVVTG